MLFLIIWVNWVNSALSSMSCVWSFVTPSPRVKRQRQTKPVWAKTCYYETEQNRTAINLNTHKQAITKMHLTIHEKHKFCWAKSTKNKNCYEKKSMVAERKIPQTHPRPTTNPPKPGEKQIEMDTKTANPNPQKHKIPKSKKTIRGGDNDTV